MPGMMSGRKAEKPMMSYKKGGPVFKPCANCPSPAKCRAAGKCAMDSSKKKKK